MVFGTLFYMSFKVTCASSNFATICFFYNIYILLDLLPLLLYFFLFTIKKGASILRMYIDTPIIFGLLFFIEDSTSLSYLTPYIGVSLGLAILHLYFFDIFLAINKLY